MLGAAGGWDSEHNCRGDPTMGEDERQGCVDATVAKTLNGPQRDLREAKETPGGGLRLLRGEGGYPPSPLSLLGKIFAC